MVSLGRQADGYSGPPLDLGPYNDTELVIDITDDEGLVFSVTMTPSKLERGSYWESGLDTPASLSQFASAHPEDTSCLKVT